MRKGSGPPSGGQRAAGGAALFAVFAQQRVSACAGVRLGSDTQGESAVVLRCSEICFWCPKTDGLPAADLAKGVLAAPPLDTPSGEGTSQCLENLPVPRPRVSALDARTSRLNLRFTASERDQIEQAARAYGASVSAFARQRVLLVPMASADAGRATATVLDPAAVSALNRVGANLNQLARRANSGDLLQPGELPEVLANLAQQLARIEALVLPALDRS